MQNVNVLICGLYFSGSSAVKELLSEYSNVTVVPGEFDDFRRAGLVGDRVSGLISSDYPSKVEFLAKNLMNSSVLYSGITPRQAIKNKIKKVVLKSPFGFFLRGSNDHALKRAYFLEGVDKKLKNTKDKDIALSLVSKWIDDLKKIYAKDSAFYVFDQPIFLGQHAEVWPSAFAPFKLIVVFRDPRDQIADIIMRNNLYKDYVTPTQGLIEMYGEGRKGAVLFQVEIIKSRIRNAFALQKALGKKSVIFLRFEDLIVDYENSKKSIENFLELKSSNHVYRNKYLLPEVSMKNVGIYKSYLKKDEVEVFEECISLINESLGYEAYKTSACLVD